MTATEIIEQIKNLPASERAQVTRFVVEQDDSLIPDEFKEGMRDAEAGRLVDMETVLSSAPPPHAFAKLRGRLPADAQAGKLDKLGEAADRAFEQGKCRPL